MVLSKHALKEIAAKIPVLPPDPAFFELPEKILQFGTGVLLRGLPDYFVDKANRQGRFNGRIVVVKSTGVGSTDAFEEQDNLYTLCVRGVERDVKVEENSIQSAISRVLTASSHWQEILACAADPAMEIVISNTTEVGITLSDDDMHAAPPASFPGKLLAFLYERYKAFQGDESRGMVIIPTELIPGNGSKLAAIVKELAVRHKLEDHFMSWLSGSNYFCNSLVDRIVPGKLPEAEQAAMEKQLGYKDNLMIQAEPYRLWAIESSSARVKDALSFAAADEGLIIAPDIERFRELKLRLLNGTHTFSCGLAFLCGFTTVKAAMEDKEMSRFIETLMRQEITPAVTGDVVTPEEADEFSRRVLDRFRNPYIEHKWLSITMNYTSKMRMRNIPILTRHYEKGNATPPHMSLAFAAYLLFMKDRGNDQRLQEHWRQEAPETVTEAVLKDTTLWDKDLTQWPGFATAVSGYLKDIMEAGSDPAQIRRVVKNAGKAESASR